MTKDESIELIFSLDKAVKPTFLSSFTSLSYQMVGC